MFFHKLLFCYLQELRPVIMEADEMRAIEYIKLSHGRARSSTKSEGHEVDFGVLIRRATNLVFINHGTILTSLNQRAKTNTL